MKYEIIERRFPDHSKALLYASDHICVTTNGQEARESETGDEWLVFELAPAEGK